ncbi:MAG: adenylate/guanylate cyclase domain-containing protein, partial [Rhodobacteraceae bacterium]|nr:adenylate/guanylate cyclase domain-containing protein [Paracoccaceae bacterium]
MRKATVMALDVVGFSKMMGENPETTVETLSARRKNVHALIKNHNGKVFNEAGDSIVSEFASSEPAALSAIDIQT